MTSFSNTERKYLLGMHFMADVDKDAEVAVVAVLHADHVPPARVLTRQPALVEELFLRLS